MKKSYEKERLLCFTGGVINVLIGIAIVYDPVRKIVNGYLNNGLAGEMPSYLSIFFAFYFLILGVWIISASGWMKEKAELRKGAITSLVLGILSLNILAVISGLMVIYKLDR